MVGPATNAEKIRSLPWALTANGANVAYVYLTFSGPIFLLFLDALNLGQATDRPGSRADPILQRGLRAHRAPRRLDRLQAHLHHRLGRPGSWSSPLLIATPWILATWGEGAAFIFVVAVVLAFALLRATGVGAYATWLHELVPASVRGRFSALDQIIAMLVGAAVMAVTGRLLGDDPAIGRFSVIFGVALCAGLLSVAFYARLPGGASIRGDVRQRADFAAMGASLRDRKFRLFLAGSALVTLGWAPLSAGAFAPLFLQEEVGLAPEYVLYFNAVLLAAGVVSGFAWGWVADRYGSKPVMLMTLCVLACYPAALWMLPRDDATSFPASLVLGALVGFMLPGWSIAYSRMLYVKIIPADRRSGYTAVNLASSGIMMGLGSMLAGIVLQASGNLNGSLGPLPIDRYTPLMVSGIVLLVAAIIVFSRVRGDGDVPVKRFAGLFVQGNAIAAMQALISYQFGGIETKRVSKIERLGASRSPVERRRVDRIAARSEFQRAFRNGGDHGSHTCGQAPQRCADRPAEAR